MIPNVVHFIYFSGPNSREFGYLNYLAVKTAHDVQKPDVIFMHYNVEPVENPHWNRMKKYVELVQVDPPKNFMGAELKYVQYQADVVRLQILLDVGGIYLDTDILMLKPLTPLMNRDCVMGGEGYVDRQQNLNTSDVSKIGSVSNAVIMAAPKNKFIKEWLEKLPQALSSGVWAHHAVVLPLDLYKADSSSFYLEKVESFVPFDFRNSYIFGDDYQDLLKLKDSYTIHMWETIWADEVRKIDDGYLRTKTNLFAQLFKKYAGESCRL